MRIAIVGTRGIPAAYGGFETLAWELSTRLAARGHEVTVYCRRGRTDESIAVPPGVRRRFLPYLPGKYPETVSHTGAVRARQPGPRLRRDVGRQRRERGLLRDPAAARDEVVLNVDGIERQRAKWGPVGRAWYAVGERFALVYPNAIVADAEVIRDYYRERTASRRRSSLRRGAAGPRARAGPRPPRPRPGRGARPVPPLRQPARAREPGRPRDPRVPRGPGRHPAADRRRRALRRGVQGAACASSPPPIRASG